MENATNNQHVTEPTCAVSVIIAMYNVEKYIGECLESLLNQTMQDFEVILVDDCSTDFSRAVVYSFLSKFKGRLKLFKFKENTGFPGIPRNFALGKARGKYVYFLDSDDILTATALEELYNVAENFNAEVVHVEKFFMFNDGNDKDTAKVASFQISEFVTEPTLETSDIGERVTRFTQFGYLWWACNKLFLRKFLVDNDIKFIPVKIFEDMLFAFKSIINAKNYVRVPFVSYYYRIREKSLSHEARDFISCLQTTIEVFRALDNLMDTQEFFKENYQYRYKVLDFFMQIRFEVTSKNLFSDSDLHPADLFKFFREKFFASNSVVDYAALTAYLFLNAHVFKLYTMQQAEEIENLRTQVDELKKIILEAVR
ncbi:MAG: glycosyltransferase [Selenomonadaceae bacterium]|nr:glycosyltransferase [Selenomonadaceae bacterium]